jgi:hypothetical protein
MRISKRAWAAAILLLTACKPDPIPTKIEQERADAAVEARANAEAHIPCALDGSAEFAAVCTVDRTTTQDGLYLTVRHPDGGFHRLIVTKDGRGVIAADGATPAKVSVIAPDAIEVAIADARYRLPATVGGRVR